MSSMPEYASRMGKTWPPAGTALACVETSSTIYSKSTAAGSSVWSTTDGSPCATPRTARGSLDEPRLSFPSTPPGDDDSTVGVSVRGWHHPQIDAVLAALQPEPTGGRLSGREAVVCSAPPAGRHWLLKGVGVQSASHAAPPCLSVPTLDSPAAATLLHGSVGAAAAVVPPCGAAAPGQHSWSQDAGIPRAQQSVGGLLQAAPGGTVASAVLASAGLQQTPLGASARTPLSSRAAAFVPQRHWLAAPAAETTKWQSAEPRLCAGRDDAPPEQAPCSFQTETGPAFRDKHWLVGRASSVRHLTKFLASGDHACERGTDTLLRGLKDKAVDVAALTIQSSQELPVKHTFIHFDDDDDDLSCSPRTLSTSQSMPTLVFRGPFREKISSIERAHGLGACRPCAYFHEKEDGCRLGEDCKFCHLCEPGELKQRKREKEKALRAIKGQFHRRLMRARPRM